VSGAARIGSAVDAEATDADRAALREAIALSAAARAGGRHPFGALVVAADGTVLARAGNQSAAGEDPTAHAETLAVRLAAAAHGSARLAGGALVTSAEPCAMCAGAAYWAGLSRVVYGLSETRLRSMTGDHPENPTLDLPCRDVFARGQRAVAVVGPLLEDEAAAVHDGFWARG
jgi:tRNA(Arg) A34 adenosine deaminase TadA